MLQVVTPQHRQQPTPRKTAHAVPNGPDTKLKCYFTSNQGTYDSWTTASWPNWSVSSATQVRRSNRGQAASGCKTAKWSRKNGIWEGLGGPGAGMQGLDRPARLPSSATPVGQALPTRTQAMG